MMELKDWIALTVGTLAVIGMWVTYFYSRRAFQRIDDEEQPMHSDAGTPNGPASPNGTPNPSPHAPSAPPQ